MNNNAIRNKLINNNINATYSNENVNKVGNATCPNLKTTDDSNNRMSTNNFSNLEKIGSNDNITNISVNMFFKNDNNFAKYFKIHYFDQNMIANSKNKCIFFKEIMSVLEIFENYYSSRKQYLNDEQNFQVYEQLNKIIKTNFKDKLSQNNSEISNTSNNFYKIGQITKSNSPKNQNPFREKVDGNIDVQQGKINNGNNFQENLLKNNFVMGMNIISPQINQKNIIKVNKNFNPISKLISVNKQEIEKKQVKIIRVIS